MKTTITRDGCLLITAENSLEFYALQEWCRKVNYDNEIDKITIDFGNIDIEGFDKQASRVSILNKVCDK